MRRTFGNLLWASFSKLKGVLGVIFSLIIGLLFWLFKPDEKILLAIVIPSGIVLLVLLATLFDAAYESYKKSIHILPKVLFGKKTASSIEGEKVLCLLEPSELFSYDALVSFYYIADDSFEQLIGIGKVMNIQDDGRVQVGMFHFFPEHEDLAEKLSSNNQVALSRFRIKPHIPMKYAQLLLERR